MRLHQLGYRQIGARTEGCNLIQRRREKKKKQHLGMGNEIESSITYYTSNCPTLYSLM